MKRNRVVAVIVVCWLLAHVAALSSAAAEEPGLAADVSVGAASVLATVIAAPVRLVACVLTVAVGGTAYGLTMGQSELIRDELAAGTRSTCGGKYYVTPQDIRQFSREPQGRK
jgi:hypothetical protein